MRYFQIEVWILIIISLIILSSVLSLKYYSSSKSSFLSLFNSSLFNSLSVFMSNNPGNQIMKFNKMLIAIWLLTALILSNAFKGLLRDQIINPPKWWFHSIEELINAPADYQIYAPSHSITYYSIKKISHYDSNFEKLIKRLKIAPLENIYTLSFGKKFYRRKCGAFATSYNTQYIYGGNEIVINEILYDHMLDVRFIRKDFQFSDDMIKL